VNDRVGRGIDVCNDTQLMKFCIVSVLILHVHYLVFMFSVHDVVQVCQNHVINLHKACDRCSSNNNVTANANTQLRA
jgi:hypothetical protein